MKTPSTVAAVAAILEDEQNGYSSAAIASGVVEQLFDGIQVLERGIQDETCESLLFASVSSLCDILEGGDLPSFIYLSLANFTRFYTIARSIDGQLPAPPNPHIPACLHPVPWNKGLLRIREPQSRDPASGPTNVCPRFSNGARGGDLASLLSALDLQICRLDRRPILGVKPFAQVYIVEVDDGDQLSGSANSSPIVPGSAVVIEDVEGYGWGAADMQSNGPLVRLDGHGLWVLRLREAAERVIEAGGDADVLGSW